MCDTLTAIETKTYTLLVTNASEGADLTYTSDDVGYIINTFFGCTGRYPTTIALYCKKQHEKNLLRYILAHKEEMYRKAVSCGFIRVFDWDIWVNFVQRAYTVRCKDLDVESDKAEPIFPFYYWL